MGRKMQIKQGYRIKKWVIIAPGTPATGNERKVFIKCTACGETKEIPITEIYNQKLKNCKCEGLEPKRLPENRGISCQYRTLICDKSAAGHCCYHCPDQKNCPDICLNDPAKCGSFYLQKTGLFKGRKLLPQIGGRKK